ncbi:MAG: hypothetical protein F4235_02790 [Candidatus Dadabacteria bacterium]|nr:hypothetical protein [Candidatus Dadabacteria bacterium]MYE60987.1 hypothetical protein [Candidatus Dadabacteria bacterium]MYI73634.1 hypothetical protein [Candidatus Dadabacteria bacterium]
MSNRLKNRFGTPVENIKILFVNKDFTAVLARNLFYNPQEFKTQQAAKHSRQRSTVGSETQWAAKLRKTL